MERSGQKADINVDLEMLQERARIIRRIRSFFDDKGYLELDTPLLSPDLIPESCLEVFETRRILPNFITQRRGDAEEKIRSSSASLRLCVRSFENKYSSMMSDGTPYWLIPSPEIWMKKIIAMHQVNVYQICKCFRNGESSGFLHSPEFTMLEYYTMKIGYLESLSLTEELFGFLLDSVSSEQVAVSSYLHRPFHRLTVAEAFSRYAGFDLFAAVEKKGGLEAEARRLGLEPPAGSGTGELYDLIFIHAVEPQLKKDHIVALTDYPAFVPCLAKKSADGKTVERWELYYNGIELANCFSEETDAAEVQAFFESESVAKERRALVKHRVDGDYWKLFAGEQPFPRCSGVAMGLDRLIMALCGRSTIDGVLPFPM